MRDENEIKEAIEAFEFGAMVGSTEKSRETSIVMRVALEWAMGKSSEQADFYMKKFLDAYRTLKANKKNPPKKDNGGFLSGWGFSR